MAKRTEGLSIDTNTDNTDTANLQPIEVRSKIWIQNDDVVFGEGRYQLFKAIEETGSISKAAEKLGMSYRAAWGKVTATEERLGFKLVERRIGGAKGGTQVTPRCKEMVKTYAAFKEEANNLVDALFKRYFSSMIKNK